MSLGRSNTRFGPPSFRGASPESEDESSITTLSLAANKLRKRSRESPDNRDEAPTKTRRLSQDRTSLKALQFTQPFQSKFGAIGNVEIKHSSPWESLTWRFSLMLNDSVIIATQKDTRLVAVREFSGPEADLKIDMLQRIQHKNFLAFLDCFSFEDSRYVVWEHEISSGEKLPVTLTQFSLIVPYPTEQELATILGQILDGLEYLASMGLEHGSLTCKNVLISTKGSIRITGQECCRELAPGQASTRDIRGIGYVTMELMHKEPKYDGPIMVRDVHRWPLNSQVVEFLLMTESAYSISELKKHSLFRWGRKELDLKWKVYLAEFSVFRGYIYKP